MVFQWNNYRSYWRQENPVWRTGWETIPELSPGLSSDFLSNLEAKCLICLFPTYKLRLMMPPLDTQGEDLGALVWAGKPLSCRKSSKTRLTGELIVSATDFDRAKLWPILGDRRSQGKSKCTHKISFFSSSQFGISSICFTFAAGGSCLSWVPLFITEELFELLLCQGDCTAEHPAETGCRDQKSVGITTLMPASALDQDRLWLLFSILQLQHFIKLEPSWPMPQNVRCAISVWELCTWKSQF